MNKITAYQCEYCNKVYHRKESCQGHERKCYKNPNTKSCISCTFLYKDDFKITPGMSVQINVCLQNVDLAQSLKTKCSTYIQARYDDDRGIKVDTPAHNYDRVLAEQRLTDKLN